VTSDRGSASLPVRLDNGVPRGTLEVAFATLSSDGDNVLGLFMDPNNVISQIRLETR
jgi:hypothetical protein